MKVLMLSHEFPPMIGGAGTVAFEYYSELSKTFSDIKLITSSLSKEKYQEFQGNNNVQFVSVNKEHSNLNYLKYYLRINSQLNKFDRILVNDIFFSIYASIFFDDETLAKTIFFVHGSEYIALGTKTDFFRKVTNLKQRYIHAFCKAHSVVFVSSFVKGRHLNYFDVDDCSKFTVINNGINTADYKCRTRSYSDISNLKLVTCSRLVEKKGYRTMLKAFEIFANNRPKTHWYIIGDGDFRSEFETLIASSSCSEQVTVLGRIERDKIPSYCVEYDIFWLLSDFYEAHPLTYMEAAAMGLPSIGWDKGGVIDSIKVGLTGYLLDDLSCFEGTVIKCLKLNRDNIVKTSLDFDISLASKKLTGILVRDNVQI